MQSTDTRLANNAVIDSDRAAVIQLAAKNIAASDHPATKEIAKRYGGLQTSATSCSMEKRISTRPG
jgi:hypothetical protein